MWELDYKESWAPRNWCSWTVVLEKTLESPLDCKEINPGCSLEGLILKLKPILWPTDANSWLIWKDPDAGKDCRQEEKGTTEDEMVGCYHWLDDHEFKQALGADDGQGSLAYCSPWVAKSRTWLSDRTDLKIFSVQFFCIFLPPLLNIFCFY